MLFIGFFATPVVGTVSAAVGINHQINFQGKLVNPNGTNVTDGSYSVVFSAYTVSTAGTATWTETQSVTVTSGVFQVNLGSVTALPASIDFNTDNIYLGVKVGADAEMTPRIQFTAVPQSFNSEKLGGLDKTGFIQNGTSLQATSNFNISGTGIASILQAATFDTSTAVGLNLGTTNATSLTVGNNANNFNITLNSGAGGVTTIAGGLFANTVNVATGAAVKTLTLGSTNTTSSTTINAGSGGIQLVGDVTVAAAKSITLVGGITATRPATPATGQLYFDTTTGTFIQYNGSKWISDRSNSTKIVAASTASQAVKDAADYIATGTGDQATINTALTAAAGGSVYLTEGTYYETASISIPNNTTLYGAGAGTLITIPNAQNASYNIITNADTVTGTHVNIHDLRIDGNKANQTAGTMDGVYFSGMGGGSGSTARDGGKVTNIIVRSMFGGGGGISLNSGSNNNTISGNTVQGNGNAGIAVNSSNYNTVTGNISQGNGYGFALNGDINNTVTGNTAQSNNHGIFVNGATNNTVTGNNVKSNGAGIELIGSADYNTVTGNNVQNSNTYGIYISNSSNNAVSGNKLHDSNGTNNDAIYLVTNATANTITGNDITDTSCATTCYAINISDAGSTSNYLANNRHSGTAANPSTINDAAPNTIYANQVDGSGNLINRNQGGLTVGTTTATNTLTLQGSLAATKLSSPSAPTLTTAGTAGTTSYTYAISALDGSGETLASTGTAIATGNAILTGTNYVTIKWSQVSGAVQYKIYRTASAGTPATAGLIGTVNASVFTLNDTGLAASGSTPAANTTGNATVAGQLQGGSLNVTGNTTIGSLTAGGLLKAAAGTGLLSVATAGTDFENPLTFGNGITRTTNAVSLGGNLSANTTLGAGNTNTLNFTSDLSTGARSTNVLSITQANDATFSSTGSLLNVVNSDTSSTAPLINLSQVTGGTNIKLTGVSGPNTIGVDLGLVNNGGVGLQFAAGASTTGIKGTFTGSAGLSGNFVQIQQNTAASSSGTNTANILNLSRSQTAAATFTLTETGDIINVASNCGGAGTCVDSSSLIKLNQQYASATGAVGIIQNNGTGNAFQIQDGSANISGAFNAVGNQLTLGRVAASGTVTQGKLSLSDGTISNNTVTLQVGNGAQSLAANSVIQIPATVGATDTVCLLSLANCVGAGGAVATTGGTQNYITKYNNAGATQLSNSQLFDDGNFVGINTLTNSAKLSVASTSATQAGLFVQAAANATTPVAIVKGGATPGVGGDLLQFQNSAGTTLTKIDSSGILSFSSSGVNIANTTGDLKFSANGSTGAVILSTNFGNTASCQTGAGFAINSGCSTQSVGLVVKPFQFNNSAVIITASSSGGTQTADLLAIHDAFGNRNASFGPDGSLLTLGRVAASGTVTQGKIAFSDGTTDNFANTLQSNTLTAARTISLPDASGTLALTADTTNFIRNQSSLQASSNFNISGTGIAGTSLKTPSLDTASAVALNIGATNATVVNIGSNIANTTVNGALGVATVAANKFNVNTATTAVAAAEAVIASSSATNKTLVLQGAASQSADLLQVQSSTGTVLAKIDSNGGLFTTSVGSYGSASALSAQLGVSIQSAANIGLRVIANGSQSASLAEFQNSAGTTLSKFGTNGQLVLGNDTASPQAGTITFNDATATNTFTATLNSSALTATRTISLPDASGTVCLQASTSCGFATSATGAAAIVQGGNSFGATADIGTNDNFNLFFRTNGSTKLAIDTTGSAYFNQASTLGVFPTYVANAAGLGLTVAAGAANGSTTGNAGGVLTFLGGAAAGSGNNNGGYISIDGGAKTGTGIKGNVILQATGGTVGIGQASPNTAYALDIAGDTKAGNISVGVGNSFYLNQYFDGTNTRAFSPGAALRLFAGADGAGHLVVNNATSSNQITTGTIDVLAFANNGATSIALDNGSGDNQNILGNGSFEFGCAGWNAAVCVIDTTAANVHSGTNSMSNFMAAGTSAADVNAGKKFEVNPGDTLYLEGWVKTSVATNGSGGFYIAYYDKTGALLSFNNGTWTNPGTSYVIRTQTATVPANAKYARVSATVRGDGTTGGSWYFDDVYLTKSSYSAPTLFKNSADSTTAFEIQGSSGASLFNADTTNNRVRIGSGSSASELTVNAVIDIGQTINVTGASNDILNLQKSGVNVVQVTNSGATIFKNSADSTTALQIQNAAGAGILTVDTITNQLNTSGNINLRQIAAPASAPTFNAFVAAGALTGSFYYVYSYVTASGETEYSTASAVISPATQNVTINIANSPSALVSSRNIFRGTASTGPFSLVGTVANNTTTTFTDSNTTPTTVASNINKTATLKVAGVTAFNVTSFGSNTFVGLQAGQSNTTGYDNTASGFAALRSNTTGYFNTASGSAALQNNTIGRFNTATGASVLQINTTGSNNTGVGTLALQNNTTGSESVAIGASALKANTTGNYNIAVGVNAGQLITTGLDNAILGRNALSNNVIGNYNTAVGNASLLNVTGSGNAALGLFAGSGITSGDNNVAVGRGALSSVTTGSTNTGLGYLAGDTDSGGSFKTVGNLQNASAIGAYSQVQSSNSIVLGSVDSLTKVGIGTTIPLNTFSVSPVDYSTGTASQSTTTVTGVGTTWTAAMLGEQFIFADGSTGTITAFASATSLTLSTSQTVASQAYRIHKIGLQVTSAGNVGIGTASPGNALDVRTTASVVANFQSTSNPSIYLQDGTRAAQLSVSSAPGTYSNISNTGDAVLRGLSNNVIISAQNATGGIYLTTGLTDTPKLTVLGGGNVGIGTATPNFPLAVVSASTVASLSITTSGTRTVGNIERLSFGVDAAQNQHASIDAINVGGASAASDLAFGVFNGAAAVEGLRVRSNGNVCIGNTGCGNKLGVTGNIGASGSITASTTPDIAETITAADDVTAADVVMADPNAMERVVKTSGAYSGAAVGVISDGTSSFMINAYANREGGPLTGKPLVLAGRVPVKITNEGGAVMPGDYLTSSSTPGYAMKATHAGPTIGKSLGFFSGTSGTVLALINVSYYSPSASDNIQANNAILNSLTVNGGMNAATINVGGLATLGSLQVTGSANVAGNLVVSGNLTVSGVTSVADITVNGHIITAGKAPTFVTMTSAGSNASVTVDGNDTSGTITLTTGAATHTTNAQGLPVVTGSDPTAGDMATITFNKPFTKKPRIIITPNDGKSAPLLIYPSGQSATGFSFAFSNLPAAASGYSFSYIIVE